MGKSWTSGRPRRRDESYVHGRSGPDVETVNDRVGTVERAPLQWAEVHNEASGSVRLSLSLAVGERGNKLYSISLGRAVASGKTSKFFQPRDLDDIVQVLEAARQWLNAESVSEG